MTESNQTRTNALQAYYTFQDYRLYITPEYFLITYQDADFVKVLRNTSHRPGFVLLTVQLFLELLAGQRTALRERWALWNQDFDTEAELLGLKARAADRQVLEFHFEKEKPVPKDQS